MVEAVHADRTEAVLLGVAVPALPDGRGALIDRIKPARILVLKQQRVGDIDGAARRKSVHNEARAQEARLKAVAVLTDRL